MCGSRVRLGKHDFFLNDTSGISSVGTTGTCWSIKSSGRGHKFQMYQYMALIGKVFAHQFIEWLQFCFFYCNGTIVPSVCTSAVSLVSLSRACVGSRDSSVMKGDLLPTASPDSCQPGVMQIRGLKTLYLKKNQVGFKICFSIHWCFVQRIFFFQSTIFPEIETRWVYWVFPRYHSFRKTQCILANRSIFFLIVSFRVSIWRNTWPYFQLLIHTLQLHSQNTVN